jgi:hypothetical protein
MSNNLQINHAKNLLISSQVIYSTPHLFSVVEHSHLQIESTTAELLAPAREMKWVERLNWNKGFRGADRPNASQQLSRRRKRQVRRR